MLFKMLFKFWELSLINNF